MSLGLKMPARDVLAIWRIKGSETCELPLPEYKGTTPDIRIAFPENDDKCIFTWDSVEGILRITMKEEMARILEIN